MVTLNAQRLILFTMLGLMLGMNAAHAVPIALSETFHFRNNVKNFNGNTFEIAVFGTLATPAGNTSVIASQGATNETLLNFPDIPNDFSTSRSYDPSKLGAWTITANNGPHSTVVSTNDLNGIQKLPFVDNVNVSGGLLTPTISWQLPITAVPFTRIRVRVVDFADGGTFRFNSNPLPANTTTYTLPSGVLKAGQDYLIRLMLEDVRNGKLVNRSENRFAYHTFTTPVTIIDGPFYNRRTIRQAGFGDQDTVVFSAYAAPSAGTNMTATSLINGGISYVLSFSGFRGNFPSTWRHEYFATIPFNSVSEAVATGGFKFTATNGIDQQEINSHDIAGVQPMPFVDNLQDNLNVSAKSLLTPRLSWDLPTIGVPFDRIRVRVFGFKPELFLLFTSSSLPVSATSYTLPSGVLIPDVGSYQMRVMLEDVVNGKLINRSETRMPYSTVSTFGQLAVKRGKRWYMDLNTNSQWDSCLVDWCINAWGQPNDTPISGDWNGNGVAEIGVKRGNRWYLDNGNGKWDGCGFFPNKDRCLGPFGFASDKPVVGDWNGNGRTTIGVKRGNKWYLDVNGNGRWDGSIDETLTFGFPNDVPVVGDWGNNNMTEIGVRRGNKWYLDNGNGKWDGCGSLPAKDICGGPFGFASDKPVVGDWNGDGADEIGVKRRNQWFLDLNRNYRWDNCSVESCVTWGNPNDAPVIGQWTP